MFTGIIQKVARVLDFKQTSPTAYVLKITNPYGIDQNESAVSLGESIANNGVCLTVTQFDANFLQFDLSPETILRSSLSRLKVGSRVNLERSLRLGDRMSGHWVQGHVDGTAEVVKVTEVEKGYYDLEIKPTEPKLLRYCVKKGSITVDGISLTIHDLTQETLRFQIIPHTWAETDLPDLNPRDLVNIEVDILAKYIERFEQHDKDSKDRT